MFRLRRARRSGAEGDGEVGEAVVGPFGWGGLEFARGADEGGAEVGEEVGGGGAAWVVGCAGQGDALDLVGWDLDGGGEFGEVGDVMQGDDVGGNLGAGVGCELGLDPADAAAADRAGESGQPQGLGAGAEGGVVEVGGFELAFDVFDGVAERAGEGEFAFVGAAENHAADGEAALLMPEDGVEGEFLGDVVEIEGGAVEDEGEAGAVAVADQVLAGAELSADGLQGFVAAADDDDFAGGKVVGAGESARGDVAGELVDERGEVLAAAGGADLLGDAE